MTILTTYDYNLANKIEAWTWKNTPKDIITFIKREPEGYLFVGAEVLENPEHKPLAELFNILTPIEYTAPVEDSENGDIKKQVVKDMEFGKNLVIDYLVENKRLNIATEDSFAQLQKLQAIKMLLEAGAIGASCDLLQEIPVDKVFTQERKDKFIEQLKNYLGR